MSDALFCDIAEPVLLRNQHALAIHDKNPSWGTSFAHRL